jgi:hypothetical protein
LPIAGVAGDDVRAVVHAIGEVHVEVPGGPEHHCVSVRPTTERMARRVHRHVGLDLGDPADARAGDEQLVQQEGRHDIRIAGKIGAAHTAPHDRRSRTISGIRTALFCPGVTLT